MFRLKLLPLSVVVRTYWPISVLGIRRCREQIWKIRCTVKRCIVQVPCATTNRSTKLCSHLILLSPRSDRQASARSASFGRARVEAVRVPPVMFFCPWFPSWVRESMSYDIGTTYAGLRDFSYIFDSQSLGKDHWNQSWGLAP